MKQRRGIRTIVLQASIFLLLGAIVNIAVAWGSALLAEWPSENWMDVEGGAAWPESRPAHWPSTPGLTTNRGMLWTIVRLWCFDLNSEETATQSYLVDRFCFGWPSQSLCAERWYEAVVDASGERYRNEGHPPPSIWREGIRTARGFGVLPVYPVALAFAANTAFYGAVLFGLVLVATALRRRRRIKRGLCPACAYPVGARNLCTECGEPIPLSLRERVRVRGSTS